MKVFLFLSGLGLIIFILGWRKLPTDPPHYGVVTFIGRLTRGVRKEGWRWIIPVIQGLVPVDMRKRNLDVEPEGVRTLEGEKGSQGRAEVKVTVSVTFSPDEKNLTKFIFVGRSRRVADILEDVISEELRQYAAARSWFDLQAAQEEMTLKLAMEVAGRREEELSEEEKRRWIADLRQGNGEVRLDAYGVILHRLNIGKIEPAGELGKAAETRAKEEQERVSEVFETDTDLIKARRVLAAARRAHDQQMTLEDAFRIVMDYKATREGHGFAIPGGAGLAAAILKALRSEK